MSRLTLVAALTAAILLPATAHAAQLPAPKPANPAADAVVESVPTFTWAATRNAATYEVQVAADRLFGSIVSGGKSIVTANTAATLEKGLPDGEYFWRVRAVTAGRNAGKWSSARKLTKSWKTSPELLEPSNDFGVQWPALPLVLRWSAVPRAAKYRIIVATDSTLAQPVVGTTRDPIESEGTTFAVPAALSSGTYYWAVTPVDADGHVGTRSRVGRFTWTWKTVTTVSVEDLEPAPQVFDPLLKWDSVPGAAGYDVEVNRSSEFTPGSVEYKETVIGTSVAPKVPLDNNTYFWRVRAVDANENGGVWNTGTFTRQFDNVVPSVGNLRMREAPTTYEPMVLWDTVPGASHYELQVAGKAGTCNYQTGLIVDETDFTGQGRSAIAGTPMVAFEGPGLQSPGLENNPPLVTDDVTSHKTPYVDGEQYCVRVRAVDPAGNLSPWTFMNGQNATAFTYDVPALPPETNTPLVMPADKYVSPIGGATVATTPVLDWLPVPGARSYWVVVAKDPEFTNIVEMGFTDKTHWTSYFNFRDETTTYHWAVMPSPQTDGDEMGNILPTQENPQTFNKSSTPPALLGPASDSTLFAQPVFRWAAAAGAVSYQVQVARDSEFRDLLDDVTTAATAYASSTTYPVDAVLYWRVRASVVRDVEPRGPTTFSVPALKLNWSETRTFRRTLPAPALSPDNPASGSGIPVLSWDPVPGAISYGFHVDQVDGTQKDFEVVSPRFTPTLIHGNGIWKWRVRANFPTLDGETVGGAYTPITDFTRRLLPVDGVKVERTSTRTLVSWTPSATAHKYKVEFATSDSFQDRVESTETVNSSYAPQLTSPLYGRSGKVFWRVAPIDGGKHLGAFRAGSFTELRTMKVQATPIKLRGTKYVIVSVRNGNGAKVAKATVQVTGLGLNLKRRTNAKGEVQIRIKPRRKAGKSVSVKVSRTSYKTQIIKVKVR